MYTTIITNFSISIAQHVIFNQKQAAVYLFHFTSILFFLHRFCQDYKLIVKFVKPGIIFIMNSLAIAAMVSFDAKERMLFNLGDKRYLDSFAAIFC